MNQPRLFGIDDAIADVLGGDEDFNRRHAADAVRLADQALGDDCLERGGQLQADLFLLGRRKHRDDTLNRFRRVQSVQGGEDHVAGFGGEQRRADGFVVAHFADQNQVRILTKGSAQGGAETAGVHAHLALVDESFLVAVQEFDGVLDGNDVVGALRIDAVNHRGQRGGLAASGGAGNQHHAAALLADLIHHLGQVEFLERPDLGGDDAKHHADVAALLEDVNTEAAQTGHAVGHIELGLFLELLLLAIGHDAERHAQHVFARDARELRQGVQLAVHANIGVVSDFTVKVGGLVFARDPQEFVNIHLDLIRRSPALWPTLAQASPGCQRKARRFRRAKLFS